MNAQERNTGAERVGKKQWIAIAVVLALGIGAGTLILRTSPAKPECNRPFGCRGPRRRRAP
jgi:cobalt-zinc-cadmium efflux system membrane fusion protein